MALKLEVTFDVGVKIVGDADNYIPIKDQIVIVCEPFTNGTYNSENIPDFTQLANQPVVNGNNTYHATYTIQNTVFTNVFVFNPTHVEEVNGKLKCTVPQDMHDVIRFIKKYNYFYEHVDGGQELKRKDTPSEISNSTKKSSSIVKNPVVGDADGDGVGTVIETNDEFAFEIQSGSINSTGDEITYNFTSTRDLTIYKEVNGNFVFNGEGIISTVELSNQDVSTLLNYAFSDDNLYYETEASGATQNFALDSGIDIQQNNKKIVLQVDPAGGKLVQTSSATTTALKGPAPGNIVATDQFKLLLEIAEDFTFTNNIKNPIIKARIDPSDAKDGYIVLDLYESSDANAPLIENLTPYSGNDDGTLRHGTDIHQTDNTDHPVASSFSISSTNSYTNLGNFDFKFKEASNKKITVNEVANPHLIVDDDRDVIKLRLDRFPRHGVDYDIYYTHKLNKTSGIFNDDGNAVISDGTTPLDIANSLQEVTATVGKLKLHYPPTVPGNFAGNSQDFNEYSEYTAYYYVDITFQRAGTNGNVDITAKYNDNYEYQYESGHNIHHGLIIDSGAADVTSNIYEDITRTRIGNINSEGIFTPVDLRSNSNQTGKVLRIEVPIAVTGASASNRYPYKLGNSPELTKYNLADPNNTPSIHLIDREELDENDATITDQNNNPDPQYYYINVMDNLGNVVSPIQPENLIKDDDWGKDSNGDTPSVESIEYKVSYEEGVWVKKLVLTHNQDLKGAGVANSLALIDDESPAWELHEVSLDSGASASVLTVSINDSANTLLTSEVAAGNITLAYTKPTEDPQNILTNWLGFEIEEYNGDDAKTVTLPTGNGNTNPAPPVVQSLSVGSINDTTDEAGTNPGFEIPLNWTISGSTDGITYVVEQSTDGGIHWTNADTLNENNADTASTTGATVSGLSYNTAYTFRVKVTTYETSVPSTTTLSSQNGPAGELSNVSLSSNISGNDGYPKVVISWDKPDNATQYKIEWDTGVIFDQLSSHTEGDGLSGFNVGEETVSYTFEGENSLLNPNETYYFRPSYSTTSSPGGPYTFGPATQVVGPVTTFPEEIETITVENSNDDNTINYNALNVSWTKPADDDGDVDYEIQYDTSSQFNSANTVPITGDTHLIDGLDASTTYYIRVRSKNESPDNPPTSQYTAWVPSDIGTSKSTNAMPPVGAPTNFSLGLDNAANTHKIEAAWDKPDDNFTYQYKLEVSTDSSYGTNDIIATITSGFSEAEGLVSKTIDDSNIAGTFSGNTTYYLRASIRKSDDNGTSWGNYGATSGNNIVTVYDKITNYTAWGGDKASEEATPYGETTVYYYNDGTNSGPNQTIELPSTPHSIDWGDSTTPHSFANLDVKLEIADNSAFTSNLKVKYEGSSVLNKALNFQGMPDPETGAYYTTSGSGSSGITFFNTWIHTYTQDPNNQNTYYASLDHKTDAFNERKWFRIYVGNPDSWDTNGDPVFNTGNPGWGLYHEFDFLYLTGEPGTLSSGNITATGFDVTWGIETVTLPSAPSGITYEYTYKVTYSTSSEFTNGTTSEITAISHPTSGTTKTQTLQSLSGNTNYYIKVSSSNQYTTSSNVNYYEYGIANDNDGTATLTLPPQVAGLSSGTVTDTSLTLTWTAIGGEAFDTSETSNDGYTVEYSSDSGSTWNESDNHITLLTHTVTGLTSETTYQFRVYATNASGDGVASTSLSVTTNATPDTTPPTLSNFSWKFSSFPNLDSTPAFDIQSDEAGTISATYNNGDDDFTISPTTISANSLTTFTLSDSTGSALAVGTYNDVSFNVVDDAGNSASESVSDLVVASSGWSPIGSDINGEAAGDYSGWSVASSSDGTIVAIGANFNDDNGSNSGHVRVYQNISGTWTQLGADIDGEATGDKSGQSVSLSNDGSIVAIGATSNDGNGTNSGHVRVYEWDATANGGNGDWDQLGNDIDGEAYGDFSGFSVSLSSDGTKLAIGASSNDGNGTNSGHVRVYEWDATANGGNGDWDQLGSDINGEATDDYSGWSVSLSSDGSIVAIGAFGNNDGGSDSGHVRVYQYTSGEMLTGWNQLGADINGEATNDYSGYSVSLNSDGSIVAIGAYNNDGNGSSSGNVRVYENISGTWTQLGSDIDGEAVGDYSGRSVSLSNDGTIVAIGAKQNDGNGSNSGHVRVYEYSNSSWGQLGADIDGEAAGDQSGHSVSLSDDGTIVAIGAPFNDGSGHVRVYEFITTIPTMTITAANSSGTAIANGSTTNDSSIVLTFTSSEVTTDFSGNDIIVTNGTLGTLSGTGTSYTATFTPTTEGACTIDVAANKFTDADGNDNTAATQFEWTYDNTAPAPAPVSAPTGLVPATGLQVIIEFTEELFLGTDVAFSDLNSSIENTNKSGFAVNLSGQGSGGSSNQSIAKDDNDPKKIIISGPTIYIDPDSSNVTVEYTQPTTEAHRLRDAAGNFLANFNNSVITIDNDSEEVAPDNQAPNLSNISNPPTLGNNNKPQFSFTSDEAGTISITSTHSSSISVSNTSTNDQAVVNGSNTFELTNSTGGGLSDNTYTGVTITVTDSADNADSHPLTDFEIDTTAPAITSQSSAEWYYETEGEGEMSGETTWTMLTNAATFGPTNKIKCFVSVTELNGLSLKSGTDVVKIDGTTMGSADSVDCYAQPGGNIHYVEMIYTIPATDTPNANGDLTFEFTLKDDAGNELDLSSNNIGPGGNSSIPNTDAITIDTTRPNLSNFSWKFSSFPNLDTTPEFEIQSDEVGTISATYNNGTDAFTISPTTINANSLTTFTLSDSTGSALAVGTYNDVSFNVVDDAGNSASMSVSDLVVDSYDWSQLGSDIDGGAAGDNSGWSVALNSDGTKLAIGAPHNDGNGSSSGHVRVYENISGTWTQLGDDIDGDAAGDQSGHSLSLSDDGSIVAIGAPYNDGSYSDSGNVRVYEWDATANSNNGAWTQKGGDIDGDVTDDYSGRSVSLSSDGSIVAIGANLNDGNGESAGHVRVFLYSDTNDSWSQLGGDIDGEAAGDNSGWSVSLSSDGSIVAIGAIYNGGNGSNSGNVRVFLYSDTNDSWSQLGGDIDGEASGDYSGHSVSLSNDGTIVAIGANGNDGNGSASGHVRVYQYSNSSNNWSQLGDDIDGEAADDQSGHSLSLSDDGSIVAIGAPYNDGSYSDSGNVRVYEYISGTWTQLGADIDGEAAVDYSGRSVSLSSDGTKLAIGAPFNDGNGSNSGHVRVYEFITILPTMTITSNTVTSGSFSYDTEIDLTFTSSKKTNDFELSDITLNNTTDGTLSDFITVLKVTVQSVSGGDKYFINGIQQDSLVLESGNTYRFDQSDSTNSGRLIKFSITIDGTYGGGSEYTTEVTAVGTLGQSGSYTEIEITGSTPTTLYYYCSQHSGMGGSVSIASTNLTKTDEYVAKLTTTENDAYTINVAANLFTDENLLMNLSAPQFAWTRVDPGWNQLGSDIDGEAAGDQSGRSVSLSSDGSIVAIGAPYNDGSYSDSGHVRVYENISGTWTQLGADIDGAAGGDYSGRSVSLSSDGTIVAIGANKNDDNGNNSGHVKVYQYSNNSWTPKGFDIDGEAADDESGIAVALSNDGSIVAIGANKNDAGNTNTTDDRGHVRVYKNKIPTQNEWDNGNVIKGADAGNANPTGGTKYWVQLGTDIDGEASGDYSGWSVALSNDGTIVAIGANKNDDNGNNSGHVKVYQYSNNSWTPKGFDIDGEAADDESGIAVALSNDGSIVAIGANKNDAGNTNTTDDRGHVRVYKNKIPTQNEWDNGNVIKGADDGNANPTSGTKYWVQLGTDIDGEAVGDYSGYSVSLSSDGEIVAIGAIYNGETGSGSGHVRVYQYTSGSWTQKGDDMDGEATGDNSGRSVSLSSDGTIVAIGAPINDGSGHVRVYKWY